MAFTFRVRGGSGRSVHPIVLIGLVCLMAALLLACSDESQPVATEQLTSTTTPLLSNTPTAAPELAATSILEPAATATLVPAAAATPVPVVTATPEPTATPTPIPAGLSRSRPAPAGTTVLIEDGWGITIVDVNLDATSIVLAEGPSSDGPAEGNRLVLVRVRVQNIGGSVNEEARIAGSDFRIVDSSGNVYDGSEHACFVFGGIGLSGFAPDELSLRLFKGGTGEGNVCLQVPESQSELILFYDRRSLSSNAGRRWLQIAQPASVEAPRPVDVSLDASPGQKVGHFRTNPTPPGQRVLTNEGLGITIVDVNPDATSIVLAENPYTEAPSEGNRFVLVRVRVENIDGSDDDEASIEASDFHIVSSLATIYSSYGSYGVSKPCGAFPDELDLTFFKGGTGEGNVCLQVPESDSSLILLYHPGWLSFHHAYSGNAGRRWLALP